MIFMKTNTRSRWTMRLLCMVLFVLLFQLFTVASFAQGVPAATDAAASLAAATPSPVDGAIDAVAGKYGWIVTVLSVMTILRLIFKPLFSILHTITENTATKKDDEYLERVEKSAAVRAIVWLLDYLASIKLTKPAAK